MGFEAAGFDNFKILDDIPTNSLLMGLKSSPLFSVLLFMNT
jgi:hypothetical protein